MCGGDTAIDSQNDEEIDIKSRVLSICQDIVFLVSKGRKLTPKHIGLGLTVHQATRSKELVELLHAAGHSVGYRSVLRIDNAIANDALEQSKKQNGVVIPRNILETPLQGYVRYAGDNIDINEETLSGMGTFHATQYAVLRPKAASQSKTDLHIHPCSSNTLKVPEDFNKLENAHMTSGKPEPFFPARVDQQFFEPDRQEIADASAMDMAWVLGRQQQSVTNIPGWSGFNQKYSTNDSPQTEIGPLPIINAPAHDFDTIWTVITKCQAITEQLRETYTVITFDEQLYCKAKMLQWQKKDDTTDLVIMLGSFHTQMNFCKVIGKHMEGAGLKDIWVQSGVYGENTAENIEKGKIWNKVFRAHKLTFEALWRILWPEITLWAQENNKDIDINLQGLAEKMINDFNEKIQRVESPLTAFLDEVDKASSLLKDFDTAREKDPTLRYWRTYMELVSILLRFTHAIRDGDWHLYLSSFAEMLPWFAAHDRVNYMRWGAVYLADMKLLPQVAPAVHQGFVAGGFVTKETRQQMFNQVPDDQALEHVNKIGKTAGGLIGITQNDQARDRWCLTYNERACLSDDTKEMFNINVEDDTSGKHKDFGPSRLKRDLDDVTCIVKQLRSTHVFEGQSTELVSLTTGEVATDRARNDMLGAEEVGKRKMSEFVKVRLVHKTVKFHDRIKLQKLHTFQTKYIVQVNVGKEAVSIKADRDLFQKVIVALEAGRDVDVDKLLEHELSPVPLSLATLDGDLRLPTNKAELKKVLEQGTGQAQPPANHDKTCSVIDGMAIVQALGNQAAVKTFGDLADRFYHVISSQFSHSVLRVDVVFDRYPEKSVKADTRKKRTSRKSQGALRNVQSREQKIGSWDKFVSVERNKSSLANFLCTEFSTVHHGTGELIVSGGFTDPKKVWSSAPRDLSSLMSDHEEADTRIILHAKDATCKGFKQVNVISQDTDVLTLLIAHMPDLCEEVWMQTGTSIKRTYIPIHRIHVSDSERGSLLAFHALTGCEVTSQFKGIGKATAWKAFIKKPELLKHLGEENILEETVLQEAEEFVCKLYDPTTSLKCIQKLRSLLFRKVKRKLETLPPTKDALFLHIKRADYQTLVWKKAQQPAPQLPSVEYFGWYLPESGGLKAWLITTEPVSAACLALTSCGCPPTGRCCETRQCTCTRQALACTGACPCTEYCRNPVI